MRVCRRHIGLAAGVNGFASSLYELIYQHSSTIRQYTALRIMGTNIDTDATRRSSTDVRNVPVNYLPETFKERFLRTLLGPARKDLDFVLVGKDLALMSKAVDVANREIKKQRN